MGQELENLSIIETTFITAKMRNISFKQSIIGCCLLLIWTCSVKKIQDLPKGTVTIDVTDTLPPKTVILSSRIKGDFIFSTRIADERIDGCLVREIKGKGGQVHLSDTVGWRTYPDSIMDFNLDGYMDWVFFNCYPENSSVTFGFTYEIYLFKENKGKFEKLEDKNRTLFNISIQPDSTYTAYVTPVTGDYYYLDHFGLQADTIQLLEEKHCERIEKEMGDDGCYKCVLKNLSKNATRQSIESYKIPKHYLKHLLYPKTQECKAEIPNTYRPVAKKCR